jgi:hypothetical protein
MAENMTPEEKRIRRRLFIISFAVTFSSSQSPP